MKVALYRGTRKGWRGIGNRLVRWRTGSIYSHCEAVLEAKDGYQPQGAGHICIGSSATDRVEHSPLRPGGGWGGVRSTLIDLDPAKWDLIDIPDDVAARVLPYLLSQLGKRYDFRGIFGFNTIWTRHNPGREHCSGLLVRALYGLELAHQYAPSHLADLLANQPVAA